MRRVVLVATSPRTPPGLLSWPAWEALRSGPVHVGVADHPQLPFLQAAGVHAQVTARPPEGGDAALARELLERTVSGPVVWLVAGDADAGLVRALGTQAARTAQVEVEVVYGSYDPPGARLLDVVAVMDRLRSPGGCPWDAAQTFASLRPYLIEEAYEAAEALEDGDTVALREELGDVLLQVAFHSRLAEELPEGRRWSIDDLAGDLVDKLVRRHPHVFAGESAQDPDEVDRAWEQRKAQEKGRTSVTDGIPLGLPALLLADKLQRRAERLGVPPEVVAGPDSPGAGEQLWALVARCRVGGVVAEDALRGVARAFRDRLAGIERAELAAGGDPAGLSAKDWRARWGGPAS